MQTFLFTPKRKANFKPYKALFFLKQGNYHPKQKNVVETK